MNSLLLAVVAAYGVIAGIVGEIVSYRSSRAVYPFELGRLRFAWGACNVGGIIGGLLGASASVALNSGGPSILCGMVGACTAFVIAVLHGAPPETGLDYPPEVRAAVREAWRTHDFSHIGRLRALDNAPPSIERPEP